jgi:hypothetical protein
LALKLAETNQCKYGKCDDFVKNETGYDKKVVTTQVPLTVSWHLARQIKAVKTSCSFLTVISMIERILAKRSAPLL